MTVEESIRAHLGGDTALAALVGDRIYPGDVPDYEPAAPWVVYAVAGSDPTEFEDLDGPTTDAVYQIDVAVTADGYASGRDVADTLKGRLNGFSGGQVSSCLFGGEQVDPLGDGAYLFQLRFDVRGSSVAVAVTQLGLPRVEVQPDGLYFDGARIGSPPPLPTQLATAGENLSALRVVYADRTTGAVFYADADQAGTCGRIAGITVTAAAAGQTLQVQQAGPLDDANWNWNVLGPDELYLGTNGAIRQGPPATGAICRVGAIATPTRVTIERFPPIYR